jgi:hypothetical protein
VRVTPNNQTLILAGERAPTRGADAVGSNAVLQRVTLLAARPDDTLVYFRADYSSGSGYGDAYDADSIASSFSPADTARGAAPTSTASADGSASTPATSAQAGSGTILPLIPSRLIVPSSRRDLYGNPRTANRSVEQYAHTQRILAANQDPHYIDVLA